MGSDENYNFGVVLDAGSSGTRIYIYKWLKNNVVRQDSDTRLRTLPKLESKKKWVKKIHPGVSTFGEKPNLVGSDHLKELLDHAQKHIPEKAWPDTPVFVLATAGMRLLPKFQQTSLLNNICTYLKTNTKFLISDCDLHVQVIAGETEGLYGWIAANYLLGGFDEPEAHDHDKGHHTFGFLDMGGASAQIAFAPNVTEATKHANDLKLVRFRTIDGTTQEHKVFVTTWLGYGVNEARRRYLKSLLETYSSDKMLDPCLPDGYITTVAPHTILGTSDNSPERQLIGTGQFDECLRRTYPLLQKDAPCLDEPCLINGQHVPAIDFNVNHFVGVSEYWFTTHEMLKLAKADDNIYDFRTYQTRVKEFCERPWEQIQAHVIALGDSKIDDQAARELCFKSSWLINMLHDGIGIPRVGLEEPPTSHRNSTEAVIDHSKEKGYLYPFQAVDKIGSAEVSWTLGKMALYASAGIAPSGLETVDLLPVGFGSNIPGRPIPHDFTYPGGGYLQKLPNTDSTSSSDSQSFTDKLGSPLLKSDSSHRIPGLLLFLIMIIIALFYLCGRDRRTRFLYKILPKSPGNLKKPYGSQSRLAALVNRMLPRPRSPLEHDRNLEEGASTRLFNPALADFELSDINDSDTDSVMLTMSSLDGKSRSGYMSPTTKRSRSPRPQLTTSQSAVFSIPGYLQPEAVDRRGFAVRTESRERLDIGGRKSRAASLSPTRERIAES